MKKLLTAGAVLELVMALWNLWERDWLAVSWHLSMAAFFFIILREAKTPRLVVLTIGVMTVTFGWLVFGRWIWQQLPQ